MSGSNLCCVLNAWVVCEGCDRTFCQTCWWDKNRRIAERHTTKTNSYGWERYCPTSKRQVYQPRLNAPPYILHKVEPDEIYD